MPAAFDPTLRKSILPRTPQRSADTFDFHRPNRGRNLRPILGIPIEDEKPGSGPIWEGLPQLLDNPQVVVLVPVAYFAANREIPIFASKPDVLQIVESFFFAVGIGDQAPILIVTERNESGPRLLALRPSNGRKGKQDWNKN
jgi:hypothetical protein